jgi:hypothetical protein
VAHGYLIVERYTNASRCPTYQFLVYSKETRKLCPRNKLVYLGNKNITWEKHISSTLGTRI